MIKCINVHKSYKSGHGRRTILNGINVSVKSGEKIGLVGRNGAGKSTLIKQIAGVEYPDSGEIIRNMTVSWPIGFNGGFQGSLTGYDNARFIARVYGTYYSDIRGFVEEFTELGSALRMPVKTYSSGMRARLAFALSLAIDFDCYLIDEVMLVGDQRFRKKCHDELFVKRAHCSMIIVSHDMNTIRLYCDRVVIIENGIAREFDSVDTAIKTYEDMPRVAG
jgi:capsular polysaccharide transport system ATP-binding protein